MLSSYLRTFVQNYFATVHFVCAACEWRQANTLSYGDGLTGVYHADVVSWCRGCTEEETLMVQELRARTPQLEGNPEHITDQMNLLRFLRGFGGLEQVHSHLSHCVWCAHHT